MGVELPQLILLNNMKAVMIMYNQALSDVVMSILDREALRGFTQWENVLGRGTKTGEPHYGNHTWPAKNSSILTVCEDKQVPGLLDRLRKLNDQAEEQGLRAFVWTIEDGI